jgi:hypothetical protein
MFSHRKISQPLRELVAFEVNVGYFIEIFDRPRIGSIKVRIVNV